MFKHVVSLLSPGASKDASIRKQLESQGALVLTAYNEAVNIVIAISPKETVEDIPEYKTIRAQKIPIVHHTWVSLCIQCGGLLPRRYPHALYDPQFLRGLTITTSQLPQYLRHNIRAAVQFFGGEYSRKMLARVNLVICSDTISKKAVEARKASVPCETVHWFETCLNETRVLRFSNRNTADLAAQLLEDVILVQPRAVMKLLDEERGPVDAVKLRRAERAEEHQHVGEKRKREPVDEDS